MTDPGSAQGSWSVNEGITPEWADPTDDDAAKSRTTQLKLDLGISVMRLSESQKNASPPPPHSHRPHQDNAENDVSALRSQLQKLVDRIHHLERALDQSLIFIEELRQQLVDQDFLENQLAATEEVANIQQRAITQLKQQLAQQQQALESQQVQTQQQSQSFYVLLDEIEELATGHQTRLVQFREHLRRDREAVPLATDPLDAEDLTVSESYTPVLEIDNGATSVLHQQIADLIQQLSTQQAVIEQLQQELTRTQAELKEQRDRPIPAPIPLAHASSLDQELFIAHSKIQELETQVSKQATTQAILQHTCHELEQARDRYQTRASELELQTAEMQEQILKQAQQSSEYETAVQHWKARYVHSQVYLKQLKALVERSDMPLSSELADLLAAIQDLVEMPDPDSTPTASPRSPKIDLPDFIARRHRYRVRS